MIHIAKDSIINQFSTKDKLDFFQLVANQLNETENVIRKCDNDHLKLLGDSIHKLIGALSYLLEKNSLLELKTLEKKSKEGIFTQADNILLSNHILVMKEEVEKCINSL